MLKWCFPRTISDAWERASRAVMGSRGRWRPRESTSLITTHTLTPNAAPGRRWRGLITSYSCWPCRDTVRSVRAVSARGGLLIQAQVVGGGQQLQTELDGNLHVGHVLAVAVAVPVVKVLDHFVEHHATSAKASAASSRGASGAGRDRVLSGGVGSSVIWAVMRNRSEPERAGTAPSRRHVRESESHLVMPVARMPRGQASPGGGRG